MKLPKCLQPFAPVRRRIMQDYQKRNVDILMRERYGAAPSSPTEHDWKQVSPNVWVKSYCKTCDNEPEPELYMVHWFSGSKTTVVYRMINRFNHP